MAERDYQAGLIKRIYKRLPGCIVLKNDSSYQQGIPDLIILYGKRWAILEVKTSEDAPYEPNQEWFLAVMNGMSWSATIYPENEVAVLGAMEQSLTAEGNAFLPLGQ